MDHQVEEVHLNTEEARSGKTGVGVRYVLAISLALIVLIFAAFWLFGSSGPTQPPQAPASGAISGDAASAPAAS